MNGLFVKSILSNFIFLESISFSQTIFLFKFKSFLKVFFLFHTEASHASKFAPLVLPKASGSMISPVVPFKIIGVG